MGELMCVRVIDILCQFGYESSRVQIWVRMHSADINVSLTRHAFAFNAVISIPRIHIRKEHILIHSHPPPRKRMELLQTIPHTEGAQSHFLCVHPASH